MKCIARLFYLMTTCLLGVQLHASTPTETNSPARSVDVSKQIKRGDKAYDQFEFLKAIDHYKEAFQRDANSTEATRKLGECYRKLGLLNESEYWYSKTVQGDDVISDDLYYYARVLTGLGRYEDARVWYNRYHQIQPEDETVLPVIENQTYFEDLLAMNPAHEVRNLKLNNDKPALCAIPFQEGILFSAAGLDHDDQLQESQVYWEFDGYLDMFYAEVDNEGHITDPQVVSELNTLYNDGPVAFDPKTQTLFVTQNQVKRAKPIANKDGEVQLKIHLFTYDNGKWKDAGDFPHTSTEYSLAHPAISQDGNHLFFASNMPGGYGGTDIYRCKRTPQGWGEPENLGSDVNTSGNEVFPFEAGNNVLYFSSDGYPGLGGLDVFRTYEFDNAWTLAENMGVPINSASDDFGLTFVKAASGFFSSNRKGKGLDDDIFWFDLLSRRKFFQITMQTLGQENGIAMADMVLTNLNTSEQLNMIEVAEGVASFEAIEQFSYELSWEGDGKTNRILFLNDEHDAEGRAHEVGAYRIQPEVNDQNAIDIRLSDKLQSTTNELEKLLQEFNVYNITDSPLYINPKSENPSWMEEYAVLGVFDSPEGDKELSGQDVNVKNRATGEVTSTTVNSAGEITFDANPHHEYNVYFERDGQLHQYALLPKGDYFEVDNFASHGSVLGVELVNREAERQALVDMRMEELKAAPHANGEVKVLNLTTGKVTSFTPGKGGSIAFEGNAKHGYDVLWKDGDVVSQHHVMLADGAVRVHNYNQPWSLLRANVVDNTVNAHLMNESLFDNLTATMDQNTVVLHDALTDELIYLQADASGKVNTNLDISHRYNVFWQTAEGLMYYQLESNEGATSLVALNQGGTKRPLRTGLDGTSASLSLGEIPALALAVDRVHFDYNRYDVRQSDQQILVQAIALLMANPEAKLEIAGHTDSRGSASYNRHLSQKRADAVAQYLIEAGVNPDQLNTTAEGEETPEANCREKECTEKQHQTNRRAELRLILPEELQARHTSN